MSDQGSEQRAATGSGEEPAGIGAVTTDRDDRGGTEMRVVIWVGDKLCLVFDADGCRIEMDYDSVSLSHDEFDRLTTLPLCAIRTALRRDECGRGSYGSWGPGTIRPQGANRVAVGGPYAGIGHVVDPGDLLRIQHDGAARQLRRWHTIAADEEPAR